MADDTADGGDAPRSASSRGRSGGKRRRSGPPATSLEIHPTVSDEPIESDAESDAAIAAIAADPVSPQSCPSCAMPMVSGAVFCGECGTRAVAVVPAATLLDSEVPGEPLPAPPTGSFAMAAAVVGSASSPEVAEEPDAAEIADADDQAEEPESDAVRVAAAEEDPVEPVDADEDGGSMVAAMPVVATGIMAGAGVATAEVPPAPPAPPAPPVGVGVTAGAPLEASPAYADSVAGGGTGTTSGSGSKKGVWVAVAAAVVLIVGVVGGFALTSGSGSSKKDDQVAAGSPASTTTAAPTTLSTVTASTDAPVTTETTVSTDGQATPTTSGFNPAPPPPTPAPPTTQGSAQLQATCPARIQGSGQISIHNYGTGAGPFQISSGNGHVTVGPSNGVLPPGGSVSIVVSVDSGGSDGTTTIILTLAGNLGLPRCSIQTKP